MTVSASSLSSWVVGAQQRSLSRGDRLNTLSLTALHREVADLPLDEVIRRAVVRLTIDGASTLTLDLHDPAWLVERSGMTATDGDGRLVGDVVVAIDRLRFRLAKTSRTGETMSLTFEDDAKALLDRHSKRLHASRGTVTRAEFIESMVAEVKSRDLVFVSPEIHKRQTVARPELPDTRPHGSTGFDAGATFKLKGQTADAGQMREVATALGVADQLDITPRVRLAELVAGIGESVFRNVPNAEGSPYGGVFGARKDRRLSTAEQARYFLKGGQGFQAGGAIAYAAANPHASAGEIAYKVEGSRANFSSDAAAEDHYQQWHDEAVKIAELWQSGRGDAEHRVLTFKAYEFTRGLPGQKETSWTAADRLAREVNWRFFAVAGVVSFVSDYYLLSQPAAFVLDALNDDGTFRTPPGLLELPDYDHDEGKIVSEVTLKVIANNWAVVPGEVGVLRNMGPASGRRIVESFEFDLLNPLEATVVLVKALPPRKEPAPQATTVDSTDDPDAIGAGAQDALAWARSKLGHYREEFGANRGDELDQLEQTFGFKGAPWCAMFATTALVHGGISRDVRTAAVAQLNAWCQAGTHGLTKGYRATPKPGDLMVFGNDHVVLVEKVIGDSVNTIDGNPSAGKVVRGTRLNSTGRFIRPDYRT